MDDQMSSLSTHLRLDALQHPAVNGILINMGSRSKRKLWLLVITKAPETLNEICESLDELAISPGFRLDHASSLDQASVQCHNRDYDLIIIDHSLCACVNRDADGFPIVPGNSPVVLVLHPPNDHQECTGGMIRSASCIVQTTLDRDATTLALKQLCNSGLLASGPCPPDMPIAGTG